MSKKPRPSQRERNSRYLKQRSRRALQAERLEHRTLLAADLAFHNEYFPVDTNNDGIAGPMDALAVINDLNRNGIRRLDAPAGDQGAEGEGGQLRLVDVDGDNYATPSDVRRVVNALNAEGETGPVMRVITRLFERPADYPNTPATTELSGPLGVGQDFVVKLLVEDIRTMGTREGVFSAYVDVNFDNPEVASIVSSLPGVTHPQTGSATPFLHNTSGGYGERAEPASGTGLIDTDNNGSLDQLDFIGSFAGTLRGPGPGEFVLVEWAMTAETAGSLTISAEPTTEDPLVDPNDQGESPLFDPGIFGQDAPVCPSQATVDPCMGEMEFVADTVTVVDRISAVDDTFNLTEGDGAQTFDLLFNDINNTAGTLTITGTTQGTLGSVLNNGSNVLYTPQANASGTDTFTYTISNGLGDTSTADVTVNIAPVNDPPINTVPGPQTTNEDTTLPISGISVADGDGNVDMTVTLTGVLGTISVPVTGGVTITNPDSSAVMLEGLLNDVNTALGSVSYVPNLNANGAGSLTVSSNDGTITDSDTISITINPINDAPINAVPGPQTVFNTETLSFAGNVLQVSDVDAATLEVNLTVSEGILSLSNTAGLTVQGNDSMSLTATGAIGSLNSALNSLVYDPTDNYIGGDVLTVTTSDLGATGAGGTLTDTDTVSLNVAPPEVPFAASDLFAVEEDSSLTNLDVLANDLRPDPQGTNSLTITQLNGQAVTSGDQITTANGGTLMFNGTDFSYQPASDFFGTETFTYTIESTPDAGDGPSTGTVNIDVQPINDGPVNSVPGAQSLDEDGTLAFTGGSLISIEDIDAGANPVTVTLTVGSGSLNVTGGGAVSNNGTASVTLDGTVVEVNNLLGSLTYTPAANFFGGDTLTVNTSDNGNVGGATGNPTADNPLSDLDTVNITVAPINDGPTLVVPGDQSFITDFDNVLDLDPSFAIDDVDAGADPIQVTLTIGDGELTISDTSNLTSVSGNGTNSVMVEGTVANLNAALNGGINYRTTTAGDKTLSVTVNDLGNNGGVPGDPTAINPLSVSEDINVEVLDFVPSNIGGFVFVDVNNDGNKGTEDAGLEKVRITLIGTTFRNTPVSLETWTDASGAYLFSNLEPGNYALAQDQPANLNDGQERFPSSVVTANGNDRASIAIPISGNIDSRDNNFGERGLTSPFISMYDLLDSQFRRSGTLLSTNGSSDWTAFLGAGWDGYSNPRVDLMALTFTVEDSGGMDHVVNLRDADPARAGRTHMDRIMVRSNAGNQVIRISGSAADFGLPTDNGGGEGEGEGDLAVAEGTTAEMYAHAVDQVFGEMA